MSKNKLKTQEEVINWLHEIYPNIEIISKYTGANQKVRFRCNDCGHEWETTVRSVRFSKHGCPKCGVQKMFTQKTVEHAKEFLKDSNFEFLKLVSESNGNKKAIFEVKCKKCGAIRRTNLSNLKRFGCDHCAHLYKMPQSAPKTQEQFIKEASYVHNNFYDYSKSIYKNNHTKIIITCPIHGDFIITPNKHLYAQRGCPICRGSSLEKITQSVLQSNQIKYIPQFFVDINGKHFFIDFKIEINGKTVFIETNGEQHYKSVSIWGGDAQFEWQKERDALLERYCKKNGIILYWIKYNEIIRDRVQEIVQELTAATNTKVLCENQSKSGKTESVDPEVTEETKESSAPYSVETETEKSE